MRAQRRLPKQGNQKSNVISIGERRPGLIGRYRSADERRAEGRALRDVVPRESHGHDVAQRPAFGSPFIRRTITPDKARAPFPDANDVAFLVALFW